MKRTRGGGGGLRGAQGAQRRTFTVQLVYPCNLDAVTHQISRQLARALPELEFVLALHQQNDAERVSIAGTLPPPEAIKLFQDLINELKRRQD